MSREASSYTCWLCHDSGWICDGRGGPGTVAILCSSSEGRRAQAPTEGDIALAEENGLNPRRCRICESTCGAGSSGG